MAQRPQDYTDRFVEVDPNNHITITNDDQIDYTNLARNEDAYVYKDYGPHYFRKRMKAEMDIRLTGNTNWAVIGFLVFSNFLAGGTGIVDGYGSMLLYGPGLNEIWLFDVPNGTHVSWGGFAINTWYYLTFTKDAGTLMLFIYNNALRRSTDLVTSLTLDGTDNHARYAYPVSSMNDGTVNSLGTGDCDNFKIDVPFNLGLRESMRGHEGYDLRGRGGKARRRTF